MYGGIFTNKPFEFNLKCIVISLFLGISYWYVPQQNPIVLMLILIMSYLAISWYDHLYDCSPRMKSGQYTPRSIFKPQERNPNDMTNIPPPEYTYLKLVYLFHLFAIAPLVIYCGITGFNITPKENVFTTYMFSTLAGLGILATIYHSFRLIVPREITPTSPDSFSSAATPTISTLGRTSYINARGIRD